MNSVPAPTVPPGLLPFVIAGTVALVSGGIAAALTRPTGCDHGPWVAAFLVLVTGVGQIGLAIGQTVFADHVPSRRHLAAEVASLNAGSVVVISGTLVSSPVVVSAGALALRQVSRCSRPLMRAMAG